MDSASERIKLGLDQARAGGKRLGRPPVLTPEQVEQCRRMTEEGAGLRHIARVMQCSPATVKKALAAALDRLATVSYQIVIEGASYREKLSPHRKLLGGKGGD